LAAYWSSKARPSRPFSPSTGNDVRLKGGERLVAQHAVLDDAACLQFIDEQPVRAVRRKGYRRGEVEALDEDLGGEAFRQGEGAKGDAYRRLRISLVVGAVTTRPDEQQQDCREHEPSCMLLPDVGWKRRQAKDERRALSVSVYG